MPETEEPSGKLQGLDLAVGMFATMFLVTGSVMDGLRSVTLGAASLLVTSLGLWLLFRWLKSGRPQVQRFVGAVLIAALTLGVRLLLSKALL